MKFLVIGASGLVGANFITVAQAQGHITAGTYRDFFQPGLVPFSDPDATETAKFLEEICPNTVIYCAGWSWVDGCESDSGRAFRENAEEPARVAQAVARAGIRFVYLSTSYVFDGKEGPYDEKAAPNPISAYGRSKLAGERAVLEATGGQALIARSMGIYGVEERKKNFVYRVRLTLNENKPLAVPQDQEGNITYAPALAEMIMELVSRGETGLWHLAGPDPCIRRSDFASLIAREYHLPADLIQPVPTAMLGQAAPRPRQGGLVIDKVRQAISYAPKNWVKIP